MSNYFEITTKKVGQLYDVKVSDNYESGNVVLDAPLPENDIDLLKAVLQQLREDGWSPETERASNVLDAVKQGERGMTIRDCQYEWKDLAPAFAA